jgi:DNA-directed RNA polymerase subunit RPC12/RpoP
MKTVLKRANFPIKVFYRDRKSLSMTHPGFTIRSRHSSGTAAERSYWKLTREKPNIDVELVDVRTGERRRHGSASWRRDHKQDEIFVLKEPPCSEPHVAPSGVVTYEVGATNLYGSSPNIYGCFPCPVCGSRFRASYVRAETKKRTVECDDCGHVEPGRLADDSEKTLLDTSFLGVLFSLPSLVERKEEGKDDDE